MQNPIILPAFSDNFIYLLPYQKDKALAVDPGQSPPVLTALDAHRLTLTHVLITHHHYDHTAAVSDLKKHTPCRVIAPDARIPGVDLITDEVPTIKIGQLHITILHTPGHTETGVCCYIPPAASVPPLLFTGDTLFAAGCGRVLETDMKTMYNSLQKLAALPPDTLIYPGHDYTEENCLFALTILPHDPDFQARLAQTQQAIRDSLPTVPSTIAEEKRSNIFLRANDPQVKAALKMPAAPDHETFAELRNRKDAF